LIFISTFSNRKILIPVLKKSKKYINFNKPFNLNLFKLPCKKT